MNCPDYQCILDNNDIKRKKSIRTNFRAFVVNQTGEGLAMGIQRLSLQDFPPGEVLIQVGYAAMNDKDALVCTGFCQNSNTILAQRSYFDMMISPF